MKKIRGLDILLNDVLEDLESNLEEKSSPFKKPSRVFEEIPMPSSFLELVNDKFKEEYFKTPSSPNPD